MGKKYEGKLCVYCGKRMSTTADHVWGRGFCLVKHRDNLPQVPACEECNNAKSKLEHYLTTVLPFGARNRDAVVALQTMVPKRLDKNQKLKTRLTLGFTGYSIPLEPGRIEALFGFVTKGLLWNHFGITLTENDRVAVTVTQHDGEGFLDYIFSKLNPRNEVRVDLGEGTLVYQGRQATDYAQFTIWRFLIYGGLQFRESVRDPNGKHSVIFAMTGPYEPLSKLWNSIFKQELPAA